MSPEDWKAIEHELAHPYGRARLLADGHELPLVVERGKGLRYVVVVYIDGKIEWGKTVKAEADAVERKFWRTRTIFLYPPKVRAHAAAQAAKRGMPADVRAIWKRQAEASFEMLNPSFASGKAVCSHLRKTCTQVERLEGIRLTDAPAAEVAEVAEVAAP